jgi:hypothetical protein
VERVANTVAERPYAYAEHHRRILVEMGGFVDILKLRRTLRGEVGPFERSILSRHGGEDNSSRGSEETDIS